MAVYRTQQLTEALTFLKSKVQKQTIVGLIGDLGYGKTTLISELLASYACRMISSPTFSLVNRYTLNNGLLVYHIDLYRLKSSEEIDAAGFWDLLSDEEAFFVIEWIDRIDFDSLPLSFQKIFVRIDKLGDQKRNYEIIY